MSDAAASEAGFDVDPVTHFLGGLVERWPRLWQRLGNLETRLLADSLATVSLREPIYVAGLARSGSTLLLEILDWHPDTGSHRYRDFPLLHTPLWWNRFLDRVPRRPQVPAERAHRDGILVTAESPEAFEEVLWMAFFPDLHRAEHSAVLSAATGHPTFERFYRDHLRKLLLVRRAQRYLSKANYNISRLEYLLKLFPDARFVVPLRDPVWHIASLMKQHRLFCAGERGNERARIHLRRAGHFEFGEDRQPIHLGDAVEAAAIHGLWQRGREVEGWARYWNHLHAWLLGRLEQNPALRAATLTLRYDNLCERPETALAALLSHCHLRPLPELATRVRDRVHPPGYYRPQFSADELGLIHAITGDTATRLGLHSAV